MREFVSKHFMDFYERTEDLIEVMEGSEANKENRPHRLNQKNKIRPCLNRKEI